VIADDIEAERIADLVVASHMLENEGVLDSFGHISVRSARDPSRFFIPRAIPPALVSADDLVEVEVATCTPVAQNAPRLNGERFIHSEVYKARPDVQCVIHSHSYGVIPFGIAGVPLRPVVPQAGFLPPETPVFEIREATGNVESRGMLVTNPQLGAFLARKLGDSPVILMRGHGDVVVGTTVREATVRAIYTEIDARILLQAHQLSSTVIALDDAELRYNAKENFDVNRPWDNFLRKLNKARS
jgi:HCOMODA/2-hydroxy-3-carboxy-muconic semialdehyde decarboxylase